MRRHLLLGLILILFLCFLIQRHIYVQRILAYRTQHPSHMRIEKQIATLLVDIVETDPGKPYFIARVRPESIILSGQRIRVDLSDDVGGDVEDLKYHRVAVRINLGQRQFTAPKNQGEDRDLGLFAKGIDVRFRALHLEAVGGGEFWNCLRHRWRDAIGNRLLQNEQPFMRSVILGVSELDSIWKVRSLGLEHILAVSGLHFSMIYGVLSKLCTLIRIRFLRFVFLFIALSMVLFLVKDSYSAQRAYFMILYGELCLLARVRKDPLLAISISAIMILLLQPRAILSTTFWLSYLIYCIVLFLCKTPRRTWTSWIQMPLRLQFFTLPISYYYFGEINLFAFVANAIALPLVGVLMSTTIAALVLNGIPLVGGSLALLSRGIEWVLARLIDVLPIRTIALPYLDFELLVFVSVIWSLAYVFRLLYRRKKILSVLLIMLCMMPLFEGDAYEWVFFDVGHGDMALLCGGKTTGMIDLGDGKVDAARMCRRNRVSALDFVILSHAHADHIGGIELLAKLPVRRLFVHSKTAEVLNERSDFRELLDAHSTELIVVNQDCKLQFGDIEIELFVFRGSDENDQSLAAKFMIGRKFYYFLGDLSSSSIEQIDFESDIEIVKVAHHGSKTSPAPSLYGKDPVPVRFSVVSHSHKYRLPDEESMRWVRAGSQFVFSTFRFGEIHIRSDRVSTYFP